MRTLFAIGLLAVAAIAAPAAQAQDSYPGVFDYLTEDRTRSP